MFLESTSNSSPRTKYEFMVKEEAFPAACAYALSAFFVMSEGSRELLDGIGRLSLTHGSMTEKRYLLVHVPSFRCTFGYGVFNSADGAYH